MIFYSWSQSEDSSKGTELVTLKGKKKHGPSKDRKKLKMSS
jgi:hypothetical protein